MDKMTCYCGQAMKWGVSARAYVCVACEKKPKDCICGIDVCCP